MDVYLKLVDGNCGQKVPVLCLEDGTVLNGQYGTEVHATVDEGQCATVSFYIRDWIED